MDSTTSPSVAPSALLNSRRPSSLGDGLAVTITISAETPCARAAANATARSAPADPSEATSTVFIACLSRRRRHYVPVFDAPNDFLRERRHRCHEIDRSIE